MMITDLVMIMVFVCYNYANDCDFELAKTENVYFSYHTPFVLNCDPVYANDPDLCFNHPVYKWYFRDKEIISKEGKMKLVSHNQRLLVFHGDRSDEGKYVCDTNNDRGSLNKTFNARMRSSSAMQTYILPNAFPHNLEMEEKGHIYWLPEMLRSDLQQNMVRNSGDSIELHGAYYISANESEIKHLDVQWFFYTNNMNLTNLELLGYKSKTFNSSCNDLDFLPRMVNGFCFSNRLYMDNLNIRNQGYYISIADVLLKNGVSHRLNFTYRININMMEIFGYQTRTAQMTFNQDTKVCLNDYFDFNCKASPDGLYFTLIYKVSPNTNSNYTPLSESEINKINITNDKGKVYSNGIYVRSSQIHYLIPSVKMSDAGVYECKAIHTELLNADARNRLETIEKMTLTVKQCSEKPEYHGIIWSIISVFAFVAIFVVALVIYRYYFNYSNGYLVKTVIVQHPNKLYVPHDTCFPLLLPDVTIKTTHKHLSSSRNYLLQQKHTNRMPNVPLSQKISKYLRKSFIFSYRHVDVTGSNSDPQIAVLPTTETNKLAISSLKVEAPQPQLILQNDAHTKYILPSNIGLIFSRDQLMIGSKIGEGAFGIVYSAMIKSFNSPTPVEVAIKTLHTSFGDEDVINLIQELEMMKMIGSHRHIIALYGACVDNGHPYMVIELAKHGNLRDFLRARRNQLITGDLPNGHTFGVTSLTIGDLLRFSLQIADGMSFLSSRMIIHRDLAARNVLVDQYLEMKVADFGLTRAVEHYYRKTTDGRLPIKWMAPECLLDRVYTVKSDVWSFGIVLWEIFTMGQTPYPTIQSDAMHQALRNGVRNEKPSLASDELYRLMLMIWNDDPNDRHSFTELVDKLTHIQLVEGSSSTQMDYLEISSNQCYSITKV